MRDYSSNARWAIEAYEQHSAPHSPTDSLASDTLSSTSYDDDDGEFSAISISTTSVDVSASQYKHTTPSLLSVPETIDRSPLPSTPTNPSPYKKGTTVIVTLLSTKLKETKNRSSMERELSQEESAVNCRCIFSRIYLGLIYVVSFSKPDASLAASVRIVSSLR